MLQECPRVFSLERPRAAGTRFVFELALDNSQVGAGNSDSIERKEPAARFAVLPCEGGRYRTRPARGTQGRKEHLMKRSLLIPAFVVIALAGWELAYAQAPDNSGAAPGTTTTTT